MQHDVVLSKMNIDNPSQRELSSSSTISLHDLRSSAPIQHEIPSSSTSQRELAPSSSASQRELAPSSSASQRDLAASLTKQDELSSSSKLLASPAKIAARKCWTHQQTEHNFFLSYRSTSEGIRSALSTVRVAVI